MAADRCDSDANGGLPGIGTDGLALDSRWARLHTCSHRIQLDRCAEPRSLLGSDSRQCCGDLVDDARKFTVECCLECGYAGTGRVGIAERSCVGITGRIAIIERFCFCFCFCFCFADGDPNGKRGNPHQRRHLGCSRQSQRQADQDLKEGCVERPCRIDGRPIHLDAASPWRNQGVQEGDFFGDRFRRLHGK